VPAEGKDSGAEPQAPVVGRRTELARLHRSFAAAAEGEATVVLVTGEAGIGKSTLIRTALTRLPAGVVTVEADCDEGEVELEYGVVDQLLGGAPTGPAAEPFHVGAGLL
jgi:hypothetical protein